MAIIVIPSPKIWYHQIDKNHFFAWLKTIKAIKSIRGTNEGLYLTIEEPIDRISFHQLIGLMTRYKLNMESLRPLCEFHKDEWLRNPKSYWYKIIFKVKKENITK